MSPVLFQQYGDIANFKVDFHSVSICAKKNLKIVWNELPYLVSEDDILIFISKWLSNWLTPITVKVREKFRTSKTISGVQAKKSVAKKDIKKVALKVTIDLKENTTKIVVEQQTDEGEYGGGDHVVGIEDIDSPFIINKRKKKSVSGAGKKKKSGKSTNGKPLVLTKGEFDKIGNTIHIATKEMWGTLRIRTW